MRYWKRVALTALIGVVSVPAATSASAGETQQNEAATAELVANSYIVILEEGATASIDVVMASVPELALAATSADGSHNGTRVTHRYSTAVDGFAAEMSTSAVKQLQSHPDVALVERDQIVSIDATWGQDRIDDRNLPLDGTFSATGDGTGVHAYVIDTGLRESHNDFAGRVGQGFDAVGGGVNDCNGHGTHVAGTVAGTTYGVAPDATVHGVRVLGCNGSGSNSGVIAGVDWVAANAIQPAVANMSLGGTASTALDNAIANAVASGVTMVVAAGNENQNACNVSPAREDSAITVGATTRTDARASFSNFGTCVDIFAPGQDVTSTWIGSDSATRTISGTSMAAPHVAGGAAIVLEANPSASPAAVGNALLSDATTGALSGIGTGSPNLLLFVGSDGDTPPPTTTPPTTTPPTGDCGSSSEAFSGNLSGTGDTEIEPNGTYYQAPAGQHVGCLAGPAGTDFDLELYRWNGSGWSLVANGITADSTESVSYQGASGFYVWQVVSAGGSGSYDFGLDRP